MPEVVERRLVCDRPGCGEPGSRFCIDDGRHVMEVILCEDHAAPVVEAARWGVPSPDKTTRASRGLDEDRLRGLIVDDED